MPMLRKFLIALCALASIGLGEAWAEGPTLRVAAFLPARSISVGKFFVPWIKTVEAEAAGELKLQGYWGGSLGRNPRKQYDLLKDGIADIAYFLPGYTPGKFPDFGMFELPYLATSATEASRAIWRVYRKGLLGGLDDVHVLGFFTTDPNLVHSKKPVKSLADIKGMKLRAAGPVYSSFIKHLGGIPVGMPVTQMTEAISRGVVDGTLLGWGGALIFRLHNVVSNHYWAPLGVATQAVAVNTSKWNGLSSKAKAALTKFSGDYMARLGGGAYDGFAIRARKIMSKGGKRSIVKPSAAEIAAQRVAAKPVHDAWIARTKDGARKYAAFVGALADIRAGR